MGDVQGDCEDVAVEAVEAMGPSTTRSNPVFSRGRVSAPSSNGLLVRYGTISRYPGNPDPDPDRPYLDSLSSARTNRSNRATEQPIPPSCSESEFGKFWSWEINRQDDAGGCYAAIRLVFSDAHVVHVDLARGLHNVKYQVGITSCDVPCRPQLRYLPTPYDGGLTGRAM